MLIGDPLIQTEVSPLPNPVSPKTLATSIPASLWGLPCSLGVPQMLAAHFTVYLVLSMSPGNSLQLGRLESAPCLNDSGGDILFVLEQIKLA